MKFYIKIFLDLSRKDSSSKKTAYMKLTCLILLIIKCLSLVDKNKIIQTKIHLKSLKIFLKNFGEDIYFRKKWLIMENILKPNKKF